MNIIGALSIITFKTILTIRDKKNFFDLMRDGIFSLKVRDVVLKLSSLL